LLANVVEDISALSGLEVRVVDVLVQVGLGGDANLLSEHLVSLSRGTDCYVLGRRGGIGQDSLLVSDSLTLHLSD
jgi:hypothetical protein